MPGFSNPPLNPDESPQVISTDLWRCRPGESVGAHDRLAREEPLEIRIRGESVAVTMRTPGNDAELAAGFLLGEGIVRHRDDIIEITPCLQAPADSAGNIISVFLAPPVVNALERVRRNLYVSSSCGICGKGSIDAVHLNFPPLPAPKPLIDADCLIGLPAKAWKTQSAFQSTGGLHAAALFDHRGELLVLREDVGRHNAVDKAVGYALLAGLLPLSTHILLVSGRASFEIMQKALAARIPFVAAVSAPSSLAVEFARESNQTLAGFLRESRFNIYAHPERLRSNGRLTAASA